MNSILIKALSIFCLLICLTGCWNSKELTDFAFLMGVSLDQAEDGNIELNAQIYSPREIVGGAAAGGEKPPYINIKIVDKSIFDAARTIPLLSGRKAQWSHMRLILIGEDFAKENDIGELLDYFYRDHETRLTMYVLIVKGKAAEYLNQKPFIERSISQQIRTIVESGSSIAGKTKKTLMLDLAIQLNSKVRTAIIPYMETTKEKPKISFASGAAIIKNGKMVDLLKPSEVQKILMLTNEYKGGIIEFPCLNDDSDMEKKKETLETLSVKTKMSPNFTEGRPTVKMQTKIEAMIGELKCSTITTTEEEKKLENHIKEMIKQELEATVEQLKEKKVDVLGIGNNLYKHNPALWKKWEKDWDEIFADIQFVIDVEVIIKGTGMPAGKKVSEG